MRKMIISILSFFVCLFFIGETGADAANDKYLIEGEAFQFKGKWFAEKERDAFGGSVLRLGGGGSSDPEYDAVTVVKILQGGSYTVWVRSADYAQYSGTRLFRLSVNDSPMALSGGHGKVGYHWEKVGTAVLHTGENLLRLHDESKRNGRCDAVLLVSDPEFDPESVDRKEIGKARRNPFQVKAETASLTNVSAPIQAGYDNPVVASVENNTLRLNFVTTPGNTLACRTDIKVNGQWRRFHSSVEDNKLYLLTSENGSFDNTNFYPSWPDANVSRTITFNGRKIPVKSEEDILNPFNSGVLSEAIPVQAVQTGERTVTVHYITKNNSRIEAVWSLPREGSHMEVEVRCKAAADGMYSIVMSSFQAVPDQKMINVLMPPMFQFRRISDYPVMMLSSMMQQPLAVVETEDEAAGKMSGFICADMEVFGREWGGVDFSPVGFSLRNLLNGIQPVAFSPVIGMSDSRLSKGDVLKRKFIIGAITGGWNEALEYVSDNVFKVTDYREQKEVSLTDAYFNIVDLMANDEYGGWNERMKGFYDIEGNPGTAPTVVHCSPLAVVASAIVSRDEDLYVSRALPTIEYMLSRSGYRWAEDIVPTGYNKTAKSLELNPFVSQFNTSCYEGLGQLLSGLNPWLEAIALPGGEVRKTKGYSAPVLSWVQYLSAYRMTGESKWLDMAVSTADRFMKTSLYSPSPTLAGQMAFYNSNVYPQWWNLVDLYEATKEERFLDAAAYGAASTLAGVRTYPLVRDSVMTIHKGGKYDGNTTMWWKGKEKFRLGFPRTQGDVHEKEVSDRIVSPVGLGFEQPGTYFLRTKGKLTRPVFLNSWAPHLLRLHQHTGKEIYHTYARNAVIGRFANYPGYYATGFTDITMSEQFPYKGPDVSSIYYHHIPPHLAFTWDYLVSEMVQRSSGNVDFPYSFQEGFVWFANRIYGGGAGRIYNDKDARLFMRKGMVIIDNPSVNYVTALSGRNLWVMLANESSEEEMLTLRLEDLPEHVKLSGKPATVHGGRASASKIKIQDTEMKLSIPSKGFLAVAVPVEVTSPDAALPALKNGFTQVDSGTAFGKIRFFRIRSPFGWDSIYVFAETSPKRDRKMTMTVICNGDSTSVSSYPFECSRIRIAPDEAVSLKIVLDDNGVKTELTEEGLMGQMNAQEECTVRGGLPDFFDKVSKGEDITVAFLGGSITQGNDCYRRQICDFMEKKWPDVSFNWVNAGVSGTGTDLGAFRTDEHILRHNPDLVFIDFAVNGAYAEGAEGIVRKIIKHDASTDICFIYAAKESYITDYQRGVIPNEIATLDKVAEYYSIPSIHMALEAAQLQKDGRLIWKGEESEGKILFSKDGLHPVKEGGNLYASSIARSLLKMSEAKSSNARICPDRPLLTDVWESASMYVPSEICTFDGNWKEESTAADDNLRKFSDWFDKVLVSNRRESVLHFAFEGDMFGIFDIGGPQAGKLEVIVDGELVKLRHERSGGSECFYANDREGEYVLDRFSRWCAGRYRGQYAVVGVPYGAHQVTLRISSCGQDEDDKSNITVGRILLRGNPLEVNRIKGVPKLKQQLKWDQKLERYARMDEENPPRDSVILFVGSSTIENWKSVQEDFPGKYILNRGVSGTKTIDMINYLEHLVTPYNPKQIFLYPGDNDIGYQWTPEEIMVQVKKLYSLVREQKPDAEIVFISIKPCPRRMKDVDKIRKTNAMVKDFAQGQRNTKFADVFSAMMQKDGSLCNDYYREDGLHLTPQGYAVWKEVIGDFIK